MMLRSYRSFSTWATFAGRADVLIPGIAICLATMTRFRRETLRVSDRGLREGILCELLEAAA